MTRRPVRLTIDERPWLDIFSLFKRRSTNAMASFRVELPSQVKVDDRWAIAAYIRALQLSAHASIADVPPGDRAALERTTGAPR